MNPPSLTDTGWIALEISRDLDDDLLGEIISRLHYCRRELVAFRKHPTEPVVEYLPRADTDLEEIESTLSSVVECLKDGYRATRARVSFDNRDVQLENHGDVYAALEKAGEVQAHGPGRVRLSGRPLALREALDTIFAELAQDLGAEPQAYSNLLSVDVLKRCDYFASFPQYLTFACHLREDLETLRSFASRLRTGAAIRVDDFEQMETPQEVLSPTVCFHCYEQLQDQALPAGTVKALTARAHCYRYEAGNLIGLERLWDFTMREIVLFGPVQLVKEQLAEIRKRVEALVQELELHAWIESATDAFFIDDFAKKAAFQSTFDLKQELRLTVPGGSVAAASFNFHNDFFCRAYHIESDDTQNLVSACVGFGLERFLYAVIAQKGLDPSQWPQRIRDQLERK